MSAPPEIEELMLEWEAARQNGEPVTPERLCAACPSALSQVRRAVQAVLDMERLMGLFPRTVCAVSQEGHGAPVRNMPSLPGYEILRVIDEGGMGVVYEARQLGLDRRVAVKMIARHKSAPAMLARFRAEAEAAARLHHPNFVQVFEVGQVGDVPYFSMEYIDGGSLAHVLSVRSLSSRRAAELAETLALAIQAAHDCDVVHRDLKPANVMLTKDGVPKIADFGLAKRLDIDHAHTCTGEIIGTPSYMSPEQAEGKTAQIGPPADVYALGAILYEMLTGIPPFQGVSALEWLRQVIHEDPVSPSRLSPTVPRDLEAICLKCLEKSPGRRYAQARDLATDLRSYLDGKPVVARHCGPLRRAGKWARRHPRGVALLVTLLCLASLAVWALLGPYRARRELRLQAELQAPRVREILMRHCYHCHGESKADIRKQLNVLNHALLLDSKRRLVVPGAPADSRLIQRIADGSMPPEEDEIRLPRLTEQELTVLEQWVLGGAPAFASGPADSSIALTDPDSPLAAQAKEVLIRSCYECHKYDEARGGIKILHHRLLLSVRKVVIPYHPDESELFHVITSKDEDTRMPPFPEEPLSPDDIEVIRRWIEAGAPPFPRTK